MYNTNVYSWQKVVGGVDNEIHNILKPREALPSQVFQVVLKVIKGQRLVRAHFVFRRGHTGSPKGTVPFSREHLVLA